MIARVVFCIALAAVAPALAQLTDTEKKLLQGAMTESTAFELGKSADIEGLRRIITLGDPRLVRRYSAGTDVGRIQSMPAAMEQLLIAHFDDPRVGEAMRDLFPRYRTRKVFDLHYARIQNAYRAEEPSFRQILRTDQEGIDEALVKIADKYPQKPDELNPAMMFVARRHHPAAIPWLVANIEGGYRILGRVPPMHNAVLRELLAYPSPDVWRRAGDELERLKRESRITEEAYAAGRQQLNAALADPNVTLSRMRTAENRAVYERRRAAVKPTVLEMEILLRDGLVREYLDAQRRHLEQLDAIATEIGDESVGYGVGGEYLQAGLIARFRLRDAREAAVFFAKAAAYHVALGQVALADAYQLALNDKPRAIAAYEVALAEAGRATEARPFWPYAKAGSPMNIFWRAWLAQELEFLRSGKPFRGRIPEPVIGGFFATVFGNGNALVPSLAQDVSLNLRLNVPGEWGEIESELERLEGEGLSSRLEAVPASRLALFVAMPAISALPSREMLRHFARNDPSGYWTACVMGTVAYLQSRPQGERRDLAIRNSVARLLPGMAAKGAPNALASASSQFLANRGLRVKRE
jgi:hypothetical protein